MDETKKEPSEVDKIPPGTWENDGDFRQALFHEILLYIVDTKYPDFEDYRNLQYDETDDQLREEEIRTEILHNPELTKAGHLEAELFDLENLQTVKEYCAKAGLHFPDEQEIRLLKKEAYESIKRGEDYDPTGTKQ